MHFDASASRFRFPNEKQGVQEFLWAVLSKEKGQVRVSLTARSISLLDIRFPCSAV